VVAAEVKELAGQTAKATEEITGQIAAIQASTGQAGSRWRRPRSPRSAR
jgi:methyl-accepting chemotaxis protein